MVVASVFAEPSTMVIQFTPSQPSKLLRVELNLMSPLAETYGAILPVEKSLDGSIVVGLSSVDPVGMWNAST